MNRKDNQKKRKKGAAAQRPLLPDVLALPIGQYAQREFGNWLLVNQLTDQDALAALRAVSNDIEQMGKIGGFAVAAQGFINLFVAPRIASKALQPDARQSIARIFNAVQDRIAQPAQHTEKKETHDFSDLIIFNSTVDALLSQLTFDVPRDRFSQAVQSFIDELQKDSVGYAAFLAAFAHIGAQDRETTLRSLFDPNDEQGSRRAQFAQDAKLRYKQKEE